MSTLDRLPAADPLDDLIAQGRDQLFNRDRFTAGATPLNRMRRDRAGSSKTKSANRTKAKVSSGRNFADRDGLVHNPKRGIRGTMPGGMVDAGGAIPSRQKLPDPTPASSGSPLLGTGFASKLLDAARNKNQIPGTSDDPSLLRRLPTDDAPGLPTPPSPSDRPSGSQSSRSLPAPNAEKFAARKERLKKAKDLARQRQFSRAQMQSGEMFNADGSADVLGSMATRAFNRNPTLGGLLAMSRRTAELGDEKNVISRMLAGEEVAQGKYDRSDQAHERQRGLLELQTRPELLKARAGLPRAAPDDGLTDHQRTLQTLLAESPDDLGLGGVDALLDAAGFPDTASSGDLAPTEQAIPEYVPPGGSVMGRFDEGAHPDKYFGELAGFARTLQGLTPDETQQAIQNSPYSVHDLRQLAERSLPWQWDFGMGLLSSSDDEIAIEKARREAARSVLKTLGEPVSP